MYNTCSSLLDAVHPAIRYDRIQPESSVFAVPSLSSSYIRIVEDFSRHFQRPPDRLGPKQIREYQSELFTKRKFEASTVTVYLAALRFFYTKTLKRVWSTAETPYPKRAFSLPTVLSQEEVAQLIDAALTPYHRTLLTEWWAAGGGGSCDTEVRSTTCRGAACGDPSNAGFPRFVFVIPIRYSAWALSPKVGAGCVSSARRDLRRGCVKTALEWARCCAGDEVRPFEAGL
jgi:Phage integrase, N-terminal SAM-like domain